MAVRSDNLGDSFHNARPGAPSARRPAGRRLWLSSLAAAALLGACHRDEGAHTQALPEAPTVAGTAASGPASTAEGDRPATPALAEAVKSRLATDPNVGPLALKVDAVNGHLVLRGATPDTQTRHQAGDLAREAAGGAAVDNELSVQPPAAVPAVTQTRTTAPKN